jgi:hypothetical protein
MCRQAPGTNELFLLQLTIFKLNSEAVVHIVSITDFSGDSCVSLKTEFLLWLRTDALAEDLLSPAHTLLRSHKAAAVVATAFTETAVPIPTSSAAVRSSDEAAAAALVAGAADDILPAVAVACATAALVAAADEFSAAVVSAASDFSARAAAAFMSSAAAVWAAVVAEMVELQFLLSIQASLLLLARSLRLWLGGCLFFLPSLWKPTSPAVVAAAVAASLG